MGRRRGGGKRGAGAVAAAVAAAATAAVAVLALGAVPVAAGQVAGRQLEQEDVVRMAVFLPMSDATVPEESCQTNYTVWAVPDGAEQGVCTLRLPGFWGVGAMVAQAVQHFNERDGRFATQFAGLSGCNKHINLTFHDDGISPFVSSRAVLDMLGGDESSWPHVVIGPSTSAASVPTGIILGVHDVPQISFWATSADLNKKDQFPLFMRTTPTDAALAYAICNLWQSQGHGVAAVIYQGDAYGEAFKNDIVASCPKLGVDVLHYGIPSQESAEGAHEKIRSQIKLMRQSKLNVVMVVCLRSTFARVLLTAYEEGYLREGTQWMVTDGLVVSDFDALPLEVRKAASGTLKVSSAGGTRTNPRWRRFEEEIANLDMVGTNAKLPSHWQGPEELKTITSEMKDAGAFAYDAVALAGLAACEIAPTEAVPADFGRRLFDSWADREVDGLSGNVRLDRIGNRDKETVNFAMYNFVLREDEQGQDDTRSFEELSVATFDNDKQAWVYTSEVLFNGGSPVPVEDVTRPIENRNLPSLTVLTICQVMFAVNMSAAALVLAWTVTYRRTSVVRASQTKFLALVAVGAVVSSSAILPMTVDDRFAPPSVYNTTEVISLDGGYGPADLACQASVWLYAVGFVLTYSSLASKLYRVKQIFSLEMLTRVVVSNTQLFMIMALVMGADAGILLAWHATEPLRFRREVIARDLFGAPTASVGYCYSSISMPFIVCIGVLHAALLLYGNWLGFQCRKVDTAFAEGKYVAVAMVGNLQVMALAIPVLIIVADNPASNVFLRSGVVFLNDLCVMCLIYLPKILSHHGYVENSVSRTPFSAAVHANPIHHTSQAASLAPSTGAVDTAGSAYVVEYDRSGGGGGGSGSDASPSAKKAH